MPFPHIQIYGLKNFVVTPEMNVTLASTNCQEVPYQGRATPPRVEKHLFTVTGKIKKKVSKNTVTFWLQEIIKEAYKSASDSGSTVGKLKSHKVHSTEDLLSFQKLSSPPS